MTPKLYCRHCGQAKGLSPMCPAPDARAYGRFHAFVTVEEYDRSMAKLLGIAPERKDTL